MSELDSDGQPIAVFGANDVRNYPVYLPRVAWQMDPTHFDWPETPVAYRAVTVEVVIGERMDSG